MLARRTVLHGLSVVALQVIGAARVVVVPAVKPRVRPGDPRWPSPAMWEKLNRAVGGRLIRVTPLLAPCETTPNSTGCKDLLQDLKNPYFLGEQPAGTESSGWVDAWQSAPSAYAVPAHS